MKFAEPIYEPFSVHGAYKVIDGVIWRIPPEIHDKANAAVTEHSSNPAGCRIRFATNSKKLTVQGKIIRRSYTEDFARTASCGTDIYINGLYLSNTLPEYSSGKMDFSRTIDLYDDYSEVMLYLPLYATPGEYKIGIDDDAEFFPAKEYTYKTPVVFYGSSITQGVAASRPGNSYVSKVCRWLDTDYINLGFSGGCQAELPIQEYFCSLDMSVFVLDYDWNAFTPEMLRNTHFDIYKRFRAAKPDTPIIMMTRPDTDVTPDRAGEIVERVGIVSETYKRAKDGGDRNVYFIDGRTLFGDSERNDCTIDGCHPTDLGFHRMAKTLFPVLKNALDSIV